MKDYSQLFVKLIASGLLFAAAPFNKSAKDYRMEEETRVIIPLPVLSYNTLIDGYDETISKFGLGPTWLRALVANEHMRERIDDFMVFYC